MVVSPCCDVDGLLLLLLLLLLSLFVVTGLKPIDPIPDASPCPGASPGAGAVVGPPRSGDNAPPVPTRLLLLKALLLMVFQGTIPTWSFPEDEDCVIVPG